MLYFQPREVLCCGELSVEVQRTLKAFTETQEGCSLETVEQPSTSFDDAKEVRSALVATILCADLLIYPLSVEVRSSVGRMLSHAPQIQPKT